MAGYRSAGPLCATTAPPNDLGTLSLSRTPAPGPIGHHSNHEALRTKTGKTSPASDLAPAKSSGSGGGGGGSGLFLAAHIMTKMVMGATAAPDLEEKTKKLLLSDAVTPINFVVPAKDDPEFKHNIYIDNDFYERASKRIGSNFKILRAGQGELGANVAAETVPGGSVARKNIRVSSGVFDDLGSQETLVHELTHAEVNYDLVYNLHALCKEEVAADSPDLYWALREVIAYVAGAYFLLINDARYSKDDHLCTKAYDMAKKARASTKHLLEVHDVRALITLIRASDTYKANLDVKSDYWDKTPHKGNPAAGSSPKR